MIDYLRRDVEFTILFALDACLEKMAEQLEESFNPKEKESIALLKTFRATIETRRKWGREYKLITFPQQDAPQKTVKNIPAPAAGKNGASPSLSLSQAAIAKAAIDDVVRSFTKTKPEPAPVPSGLLCC